MSARRAAASAPVAKRRRGPGKVGPRGPRETSTLEHEMVGDRDENGDPITVCRWCAVRGHWRKARETCPGGFMRRLAEREGQG